jgi:membrane-associated phospholipid phosphatase
MLFTLAGVATLVFAEIAEQIVQGDADAVDRAIALRVHTAASPALDAVMIGATYAGSLWVIVPVVAITMAYAWRLGHHRLAVILGAGWLVAETINTALKLMFERPRPGIFGVIVAPTSWSFPSGHAMRSVAIYGAIAAVVSVLHPRLTRGLIAAVAVVILAIGLSRVYLGVHWPTDVLAGYAIGAILLSVTVHLTHRAERVP